MIDPENNKGNSFFSVLRRSFKQRAIWLILFSLLGCARVSGSLHLALPESPVPYDQAWRASLEVSLLHYDHVVIEDKAAGYFQTSWDIHQVGVLIGAPVKRSRLIGQVENRNPYRLNLEMEQEAFSMELGRWVSDRPDRNRLSEINERFRARLRF